MKNINIPGLNLYPQNKEAAINEQSDEKGIIAVLGCRHVDQAHVTETEVAGYLFTASSLPKGLVALIAIRLITGRLVPADKTNRSPGGVSLDCFTFGQKRNNGVGL